jgi:phytoene dehydrogenase-like protein
MASMLIWLTFSFSGAGAGGIATATKLAKAGFQVTVIEKHGFVGGRCSLIRHDGYVSPTLNHTITFPD